MRSACGPKREVNAAGPGRSEHRRSRGAFDQDGDAHTEYTPIGHSTSLASRLQTLANPGSIAIERGGAQAGRGLLPLKRSGAGADQRRQRAGQRLRGDRAGAAAHAAAAFGRPWADEVRRARARDGGAQARGRAGQGRGAGRSSPRWPSRGWASRGCFSSSRRRRKRDGWCWRLFRYHTARRRPTCR